MRIAVGGVVRDRWTVGPYLEALDKLDTRGIDAVRTFVDGHLVLVETVYVDWSIQEREVEA